MPSKSQASTDPTHRLGPESDHGLDSERDHLHAPDDRRLHLARASTDSSQEPKAHCRQEPDDNSPLASVFLRPGLCHRIRRFLGRDRRWTVRLFRHLQVKRPLSREIVSLLLCDVSPREHHIFGQSEREDETRADPGLYDYPQHRGVSGHYVLDVEPPRRLPQQPRLY